MILFFASAMAWADEPEDAWARLAEVPQLQATFTEVQTRKLLKQPLVSTGTLAFARPDKLRWEVTGAGASVFVIDGAEIAVKMPGVPTTEHLDLTAQPQLAGLVAGLTVWLAGDFAAVQASYDVTWTAPATATLVPKDPRVARMVARLTLRLSADGRYIEAVDLAEPDGDTMAITLSDVDTATPVPPERFHLE